MQSPRSTSVTENIYQGLRRLILNGAVELGYRLPSSRTLAAHLDVSRGSVSLAIDRLSADGWLATRRGSGSYVSYSGPYVAKPTGIGIAPKPDVQLLPFALGVAPVDIFPKAIWAGLQSRRWRSISAADLQDRSATAWPGLQDAIAGYLAARRGLAVLPAQIVVSSCIPALVDLLVRSLGVPECEAWVETPGFPGWWRALRNCNVRMHPIPVDESGIDVSVAIRTAPLATLAVVAPNNQFPTGVAMSNARRLELLAWAANQNSWIVEDDFDWQLAGPGAPTPLALLDGTRVVYCDTFNHILFPSLRIAYAVIPLPLLDKVITARRGIDGSMNLSVQMTLADFIAGGHLDNHLARIDEFRAGSAAALEALLEHDLSELVTPLKATGGHYICKPRLPLARLLTASRRSSTIVENMDDFRLTAEGADQVLLGHFGFATAALAKAATSLRGAVLSSLRNP